MTQMIGAILFDVGGTLRRGISREFSDKARLCQQILALTGIDRDPAEFTRMLDERANAYRKWCRQEMLELTEVELWTRWMLPEQPWEKISTLAVELNQKWRHADRIYTVLPDAKETILGLFRAGYRLGLVSNTTSSLEAPNLLNDLGISGCFEAVVLSCQVGLRKPRPEILHEATRRMEVRPEQCAYIGNLPDRDVASARQAGFGKTVILGDRNNPFKEPIPVENDPDHYIDSLKELLHIFPAINQKKQVNKRPVYDASLSTMWGIGKFFEFKDFFLASKRLGFTGVELNHQVSPALLKGVDLRDVMVPSIHEPCPAAIPANTLKKEDLLISSPEEERRREGINSIKRSVDLEQELGAHTIVIHPGQVQSEDVLEKELRTLITNHQAGTEKFNEIHSAMVEYRSLHIEPYLDAVKKSLLEILDYASRGGIRLGLENRFHYYDLPTQEELDMLLGLADPDRLGFIYDVGHAQTLDRMGFGKHEEWLKRFGNRIIGIHLHDVNGINDHQPPGMGNVDFHMVARYLPKEAFRTLEVHHSHSPEQLKNGLKILEETGCINRIT